MPKVEAADEHAALSNSVKLDEPAKDAIADKISDGFAKAFADVDDTDVATDPPAKEPVETPVEAEPVAEEPAAEPEAAPAEAASAAIEPEEAAAPSAPTLPAAHVRSLKALEWTEAEIATALKSGGQGFITTAAKLHESRNRDVARYAEAGRKLREGQPTPAAKPATTQGLTPFDVAELKKQFGDEPLIEKLVGPINQAIERINGIMPVVDQYQASTRDAQLAKIGQQVDGFFAGKELEPLREHYGSDVSKLTPEQTAARQKVLEVADAIYGGAKLQGRILSLDECLQWSLDSLTGDLRKTIVRQEVAGTMRQRNASLTLRPGGKKPTADSGGPAKDRRELEGRVRQRLAAIHA